MRVLDYIAVVWLVFGSVVSIWKAGADARSTGKTWPLGVTLIAGLIQIYAGLRILYP